MTKVVTSIVSGVAHSCALFAGGQIKCWGSNEAGQLGLGDTSNRGRKPEEMGEALPFVDLGSGSRAVQLSLGARYSCALLDSGRVKCWGSNERGVLGLEDTKNRGDAPGQMGDNLPAIDLGSSAKAIAVSAGFDHACVVLEGGQAKCWGGNVGGELGLEDDTDRGQSPQSMGDHLPPINLGTGQDVVAISAGDLHTCALLASGQAKCWGLGNHGELGRGDGVIFVGNHPGDMGDHLPTVDLGTGAKIIEIRAGAARSCALLGGGKLKCWGLNDRGALGLGDQEDRGDGPGEMGDQLPAVDLGTGAQFKQFASGGSHSCALLDSTHAKCWGDNGREQLGQDSFLSRNSVGDAPGQMGDALPAIDFFSSPPRQIMMLSAGTGFSCALLDFGEIRCWGFNQQGEVGAGTAEDMVDEFESGLHVDLGQISP
jgi:alpha-tubulin suppressor-like RCC1 family protein